MARALGTAVCALAVAACGSATTVVSQAGTQPQLTVPPVDIQPVGDAAIVLTPPGAGATSNGGGSPVTFSVDDAGLLNVAVSVRNAGTARTDVTLTATCFDPHHIEIAIATGGDVFLNPGAVVTVTLTGPRPALSIKSATIMITTHPSVTGPTPTA